MVVVYITRLKIFHLTQISFNQRTETMEHFVLILVSVLLARSTFCLDNDTHSRILYNPCFGRRDGFARDLAACERYYYCQSGTATPGRCDFGYVFDAETELCVIRDESDRVCFKCPTNKAYDLISVPNACSQFIRCFNGRPTLHICPERLVFDGRSGIHQCNTAPYPDACNREDLSDIEYNFCPPVYHEPIFFVDQRRPTVYYVCYGQQRPERNECPNGLQFDVYNGICT